MLSFFKKKKPSFDSIIWMSAEAKYKAIGKFANEMGDYDVLIVFSSFSESLNKITTFCSDNAIACHDMQSITDFKVGGTINLINQTRLQEANFSKANIAGLSYFIALEHYPVKYINDKLYKSAIQNFRTSKPFVYISLDSPLLSVFGADKIKQLMIQLGTNESESIQHKLISQSIERALEKVDKSVKYETKTESEIEWYAKNFENK